MALIRCPECGREISDKAAACIHCGCPISAALPKDTPQQTYVAPADNAPRSISVHFNASLSGADNAQTPQVVYVPELGRNVEFPLDNDIKVGESYKVTLREGSKYDYILFIVSSISRTAQASSAAYSSNDQARNDAYTRIKNYKPNLLVRFFKTGFLSKTIGMTITFIVAGRFGDADMEVIIPILGICIALLWLGSLYPLASVKHYCKKHHIDEAIRRDSGYMNVSIATFNTLPTKKMLAYIRDLNPAAAQEIERQQAERKKK